MEETLRKDKKLLEKLAKDLVRDPHSFLLE